MLTSRSPRRGLRAGQRDQREEEPERVEDAGQRVQVDRLPLGDVAEHLAAAHQREREQHQARAVRDSRRQRPPRSRCRSSRSRSRPRVGGAPSSQRPTRYTARYSEARARTCRARSPRATSRPGSRPADGGRGTTPGTSTVNTSTPSSASPNISGRSDRTVKLHASAGMRERERTHAVVGRVRTRCGTGTRRRTRRRARRRCGCRTSPIDASSAPYISSASHDCAIQCVPGRGERVRVAVRDAVVEDQPAGAQVPEERVVAQRAATRARSRRRRRAA